jgi:hypothetical protein
MLEILAHLKQLLELYQSVQKNEIEIIDLLIKEIEQISKEGKGNNIIKTLLSEYNYPRKFEEDNENEIYNDSSFILRTNKRSLKEYLKPCNLYTKGQWKAKTTFCTFRQAVVNAINFWIF